MGSELLKTKRSLARSETIDATDNDKAADFANHRWSPASCSTLRNRWVCLSCQPLTHVPGDPIAGGRAQRWKTASRPWPSWRTASATPLPDGRTLSNSLLLGCQGIECSRSSERCDRRIWAHCCLSPPVGQCPLCSNPSLRRRTERLRSGQMQQSAIPRVRRFLTVKAEVPCATHRPTAPCDANCQGLDVYAKRRTGIVVEWDVCNFYASEKQGLGNSLT